jgi:predicted RecB family nuclease
MSVLHHGSICGFLVLRGTMITAHHLTRLYCPCSLYLHLHAPQSQKSAPHPFLLHLQELGLIHEAAIASRLPHASIPDGTIPSRAQSTLDLMKQRAPRIYQPVLSHSPLLGIPDFLELDSSTPIPSYRPIDVKIASSPKPEHIAQLAFYGLLLGHLSGHIPESGDLTLQDGERQTIPLHDHIPQVETAIQEIAEIQNGREELPTLSSSDCGMCGWREHCLEILKARKDISLLNGLGRGKKEALNEAGYEDLSDIAQANSESLCEVRGVGETTAHRMIMQASVLLENEPEFLSTPLLPRTETELYLDMECQQASQVIYLTGVLECREGEEEFRPLVAERPEDEGQMWAEFLGYLDELSNDLTIYHYHHFEATHLRKLAQRHGVEKEQEVKLFGNRIDLHRVLKESVVLPVHSYGLKTVAKWMGFEWRETGSDAAMSMLWFDLWLNSGEREFLDLAVEYNEDDCRATKRVREWMEGMGVSRRRYCQ